MWKKIKSILSSKENQTKSNESQSSLHFSFDENEPDDMVFVKKFNASGGNFIYCENQKEFLFSINSILLENNISELICFDDSIQKKLDKANIQYKIEFGESSLKSDFLLMPCEYLIAFDGSIMVSSDQTKKYKINELPYNIIIYANASQVVTNISSALRGIKSTKDNQLPSNITCLKGNKLDHIENVPNAKNIYLLMIEEYD